MDFLRLSIYFLSLILYYSSASSVVVEVLSILAALSVDIILCYFLEVFLYNLF